MTGRLPFRRAPSRRRRDLLSPVVDEVNVETIFLRWVHAYRGGEGAPSQTIRGARSRYLSTTICSKLFTCVLNQRIIKQTEQTKHPRKLQQQQEAPVRRNRQCARAWSVKCPMAVEVAASTTFVVAAFDNGGLPVNDIWRESRIGRVHAALTATTYEVEKSK